MTPTLTTPDQTEKANQLIDLWLTLDHEAQDQALARLIAAAVHSGEGSALERFAGTGHLEFEAAMAEINSARVPIQRETWLDSLGRFVLLHGGRP